MPRINWGQAAGEAVLILLGVLLALAADTWWEARSERRTEREYLNALAIELSQMDAHDSGALRSSADRLESATIDGITTPEERDMPNRLQAEPGG